jgi:cytochrome c biogenesis protein CcdA
MGGYGWFLWLIAAALFGYLWLLVKIAKPRPITKPIKDSKAWLITQTMIAWLCAFLFGFKTLAMLAPNSKLQQLLQNPNPSPPYSAPFVAGMWFGFLFIPR